MIKRYKNYYILMLIFLFLPLILCFPLLKDSTTSSTSDLIDQTNRSYPDEKRASPAYDTIKGNDGKLHYRVFFWVPKEATRFAPYADAGVKTDVPSHGPVEKWSVEEIKTDNANEKLVFIFVPKTFAYLYGNGFEKVIHLKYS